MVLFVADVAQMTTFYAQIAQMSVLHQESGHAVLAIDGLELVIHSLPPAAIGAPVVPVVVRDDAYAKLCLPVRSIAEARDDAQRHGGAIASPKKEWEARGFRACDGHDPEGNVIQVRERV